jgi:hypothetical protein
MPSNRDDGSIGDGAGLLRRIHPLQVVQDQNFGGLRAASAAFKDPTLSVDAEPILEEDGLDWKFSLNGHAGYSLVRFLASVARQNNLPITHDPLPDNRAHTIVGGKKTNGIATTLRKNSEWVHLE